MPHNGDTVGSLLDEFLDAFRQQFVYEYLPCLHFPPLRFLHPFFATGDKVYEISSVAFHIL